MGVPSSFQHSVDLKAYKSKPYPSVNETEYFENAREHALELGLGLGMVIVWVKV
jgi:hypothetical protein